MFQETDWNQGNANALEDAIFDTPKIKKHILEAMCQSIGFEYMGKEKEINQFELLERLIKFGRDGSEMICAKFKLSQELNEINQTLLEKIDELKDITWRVNCKFRSVRQAVILEREYSDILLAWTNKINQVVMTENQAKKWKMS